MGRSLFPGLRAALGIGGQATSPDVESKAVSYGYASTTFAGAYGFPDRAAGWDMDQVIVEGYERSVWVYRCVETIGGHASRLPFRIGQNLGEEDEEVLDDHPLYRVLNKQANPLETGRAFRKRLSAHVLLSKRGAFVEITRSRAGTITRLDLLPPERVLPIPDPRGDYLSHFEFTRLDGQMREIDPERIRWVREPHPTDPFCGTTPLDAAGLSIALDHLSRQYNVSFIENDSRPSGVIGIDVAQLPDSELDRIERKFKPGAQHAGSTIAIGTGPGGIKYVDTSTRPRDMNYAEASKNAKLETLAAFGMPESVLGNASERTYSNADQEEFNYWTMRQVPHNELIADAFIRDIDEDWEPYLDTSTITALELPRRKLREEALKEFMQGLRSIDEYRPLAGLDRVHTAQTRALWISPAKAPIPTNPLDAAELGGGGGEMPPGGDQAAIEGGEPGSTAMDAVQEALAAGGAPGEPGGSAAAAVAEAEALAGAGGQPGAAAAAVGEAFGLAGAGGQPGAASQALEEALQRKALGIAEPDTEFQYDGGTDEHERTEMSVTAALEALLARQLGILTSRLHSAKIRKGTKFWQADGGMPTDFRVGEGSLDAAKAVDGDRWAGETVQTLTSLVQPAAAEAGLALLTAFALADMLAGLDGDDPRLKDEATRLAAEPNLLAVTLAGEAMRGWLNIVEDQIAREAEQADKIETVTTALRALYEDRARPFAEGVGALVAQVAVVGARDVAARSLTPLAADNDGIVRTWLTQADARVRDSHQSVAGRTLPVGTTFVIDGAPVRWPGDPFAPPDVSRNCRCRLVYRAEPGQVYISGASVDRE